MANKNPLVGDFCFIFNAKPLLEGNGLHGAGFGGRFNRFGVIAFRIDYFRLAGFVKFEGLAGYGYTSTATDAFFLVYCEHKIISLIKIN